VLSELYGAKRTFELVLGLVGLSQLLFSQNHYRYRWLKIVAKVMSVGILSFSFL